MLRIGLLFSSLFLLTLTACGATRFEADVTSFHVWPGAISESLTIVAARPNATPALEFTALANQVGDRLATYGFVSVPEGSAAQVVATLGLESTGYEATGRRGGSRIGIGVGGGSRHVGLSTGLSIPIGGSEPAMAYERLLTLTLRRQGSDINFYEVRVISHGQTGEVQAVVPYLIDALFRDFPGPSGTTHHVTIDIPAGPGGDY